MKAIFVMLLAATVFAAEQAAVKALTDATFEAQIKESATFVKFFAPWCGHCKRLAPTYEDLAKAGVENVVIAEVDCTVNKDVCSKQEVRGYPTVKFFHKGSFEGVKYQGDRSLDDMKAFITRTAAEPAPKKQEKKEEPKKEASKVVALTDATFDAEIKKGPTFVKFFAPWCGHCKRLAPTYEELAAAGIKGVTIAEVDCTVQKEVCGKQDISGYPTVKLFLEKGEKSEEYLGARSLDDMKSFITARIPAPKGVVALTDDTFDSTLKTSAMFVKFFAPWCGHCKRLAPTYEELAGKGIKDVIIAEVDCTVNKKVCDKQEVRGYPTVKFFAKGSAEGVKYQGDRSLGDMENFIAKQVGTPAPKKEEPKKKEEKKEASKVVALTDATFDAEVKKQPVLVKFFAPWCGHCKRLAPTYEELAAAGIKGVTIAEVDCTVNKDTCQKFEIRGYPTIKLFLEKGEKSEEFRYARTLEDLKKFLNKHVPGSAEEAAPAPKKEEPKKEEKKEEEATDVVVLTDDTFDAEAKKGPMFVKFYAPWCGHCKMLAPKWVELAKRCKAANKPYQVVEVDVTANPKLSKEYGITSIPTIFMVAPGKERVAYKGAREIEPLMQWADEQTKADVKEHSEL